MGQKRTAKRASGKQSARDEKSRKAAKKAARRRRARKRRRFLLAAVLLVTAGIFFYKKLQPQLLPAGNMNAYPQSMVEFMQKYPQARTFVMDYPKKKDRHAPIDLSGEVVKGQIPLFMQWDERWGYEIYGTDFLGVNGCGPTSLSMVYCGLTGDTQWNPYKMAQYSCECGYYVDGVGTAWALMEEGASNLGLTVHSVALDGESVLNALYAGMTLICSMGPGDFTYTGHFVVLKGVDDGGKIQVADCNSPDNSRKVWDIEELMPQMRAVWGYSYDA